MDLWNNLNLVSPTDFCTYSRCEMMSLGNIENLVTSLKKASEDLGQQHLLWAEIKVFQTIKRRLAPVYMNEKFIRFFKQVDHCLKNFSSMNISHLLGSFSGKFSRCLKFEYEAVDLPSRQEFEFLLIRIQGASKLLCSIQNYTQQTFIYLLQNLGIGHILNKLIMACAVTSRLNVLCKALMVYMCDLYKELKQWSDKFKPGLWQWEHELDLPDDLLLWLNPKELKIFKRTCDSNYNPSILNKFFGAEKRVCGEETASDLNAQLENIHEEESMDLGKVVPRTKSLRLKKKDTTEDTSRNEISCCAIEEQDSKNCVSPISEIKPVKTLKKLKVLVECLHDKYSPEQPLLARKLRSMLRECKRNSKLLKQNGEIMLCKRMIIITSREIIAICQKK